MTTLDYLEKIDETLAHWEDYFHGQEGVDVTEARANLDKARKQLTTYSVVGRSELLGCDNGCDWYSVGYQLNGHQQCRKCGKQKAF